MKRTTPRLIVYRKYKENPNIQALSLGNCSFANKQVIGYCEAEINAELDSKNDLSEFKNYIKNHPLVEYSKFFLARQTEVMYK